MLKSTKFLLFLSGFILISCKKDKVLEDTDLKLYEMAEESNGFTWFKNSTDFLAKSSGTGHSQAFLRTKYNTIASTILDSTGKIIVGTSFPEGSLIVKELYNEAKKLERYAMLYKNSGNPNADDKGWVWGYIDSDKKVVIPASDKGKSCINCHSQSENIDYMLMNKYFP